MIIEIQKRNDVWEAMIDGGLFEWDENLETVLESLAAKSDHIIELFDEEAE